MIFCRKYDIVTSLFDKWVKPASDSGSFHEKEKRTKDQEEFICLGKENQQKCVEPEFQNQPYRNVVVSDLTYVGVGNH